MRNCLTFVFAFLAACDGQFAPCNPSTPTTVERRHERGCQPVSKLGKLSKCGILNSARLLIDFTGVMERGSALTVTHG